MAPDIPDKLPCESVKQLEQEILTLQATLSLEETEETWDRIARALTRFNAVVKGGGYKYEKELVNGIKASTKPIVSAMNSERTRLSGAALDCLTIIAPRLGLAFESLVPLFVPHILRLATRTNKVYVTRSQTGLALILSYCHIPSIIPHLLVACKESKIVTGRAVALEGVLRCLNKWDWTQKEIKARVGDVEEIIKITGTDKDAGIRQTSRKVFEAYKALFPDRVDEFTGPLTPVIRKYLNVKPQNIPSKAIELARPLSAQEKTKRRPPIKPDFASSTSAVPAATSNARPGTKTHVRSASSNAIIAADNMPPPASVPSRSRNVQSQFPSADHHESEQHSDHERQRVISAASSTFSIKSAPPNPQHPYQHRPPMRLATSQSKIVNSVMAASSGQARRVRRVKAVEPHPANRPQVSTTTPKTPIRPVPLAGVGFPLQKPTRVPGKGTAGVLQDALASAPDVVSEPDSAPPAVERKGAQRVLKPVLPAPPQTAGRPEMAMSDNVKQEAKPSIFRRAAPNAKKNEKPKEGFAPRRGGGVTQPTLSQLSKQRARLVASGAKVSVRGRTPSTSVASKRPVLGAGTKLTASKSLPRSQVPSQNGVAEVPTAKQDLVTVSEVQPAMIPLPESPAVAEKNVLPLAVPLFGSPKALRLVEETHKVGTSDGANTEETSEIAQGSTESQTNSEIRPDKPQEIAQDSSNEDRQDFLNSETDPPPRTPPYPSFDEDCDEDELEAIEFVTGIAYDSAGAPIKMPSKVVHAATGIPERNPLAEVVLNG